jgi:hypothetical protein
MKTAAKENARRWATTSQQPSSWRGRPEQISFVQMGCEARKLAATGEIFFLDFSFYRTIQHLGRRCHPQNWWSLAQFFAVTPI